MKYKPSVNITVSKTIKGNLVDAFAVLKNFSQYSSWWPIPVRFIKGIEEKIEIQPLPFVTLTLVQRPNEQVGLLEYKYVEGPFRGIGTWHIRIIQEHPNHIEIRYSVQLIPINWLVKIVASTSLFKLKHSWDIIRIIRRLERMAEPPDQLHIMEC